MPAMERRALGQLMAEDGRLDRRHAHRLWKRGVEEADKLRLQFALEAVSIKAWRVCADVSVVRRDGRNRRVDERKMTCIQHAVQVCARSVRRDPVAVESGDKEVILLGNVERKRDANAGERPGA